MVFHLKQSSAVLVNVSVAERTPVSLVQMARSIQPSWCPIAFTNNLHALVKFSIFQKMD
jgi:hypothetical protein